MKSRKMSVRATLMALQDMLRPSSSATSMPKVMVYMARVIFSPDSVHGTPPFRSQQQQGTGATAMQRRLGWQEVKILSNNMSRALVTSMIEG